MFHEKSLAFSLRESRVNQKMAQSHYWNNPFIKLSTGVPDDWTLYVFYLRESRIKAKIPAIVEALSLLRPFDPMPTSSGPLAERRGIFWIGINNLYSSNIPSLLPRLGYSIAVDEVVPFNLVPNELKVETEDIVRWHGRTYFLRRIYQEDKSAFRDRAPDKRQFIFEDYSGKVRAIKGYRGDGFSLSRRGLPVEDARVLVNLVSPKSLIDKHMFFLDPFAGVGGVVLEAQAANYKVFSIDIDKRLRIGLSQFGAIHQQASAIRLPFASNKYTAIATEPPYHESTRFSITEVVAEFTRVLMPGGRVSMLVAAWQAELLLKEIKKNNLTLVLNNYVNRKGTDVSILVWEKP